MKKVLGTLKSRRASARKIQRHKSYTENCLIYDGGEAVCKSENARKEEISSNIGGKKNIVVWGITTLENNLYSL